MLLVRFQQKGGMRTIGRLKSYVSLVSSALRPTAAHNLSGKLLMTDNQRTQPLREWNRIARENTENAMVSCMFEGTLKASEPTEAFTTWLLVGTATVASFFISNADKLLPVISKAGFVTCGVFLCVSCVFGLFSKVFALRCRISSAISSAVKSSFLGHLEKHKEEEKKIQEGAEFWGIDLQSEIRMERVLREYLRPFPTWVRWLAMRHLKKNASNPQIAYLAQIKCLHAQGTCAFLQAICFIGFLGAGFVYAAIQPG